MKLPSIKRLGPTKGSQLELKHGLGRSAISSAVANPAALFEHLCPPAFVDVTSARALSKRTGLVCPTQLGWI